MRGLLRFMYQIKTFNFIDFVEQYCEREPMMAYYSVLHDYHDHVDKFFVQTNN